MRTETIQTELKIQGRPEQVHVEFTSYGLSGLVVVRDVLDRRGASLLIQLTPRRITELRAEVICRLGRRSVAEYQAAITSELQRPPDTNSPNAKTET